LTTAKSFCTLALTLFKLMSIVSLFLPISFPCLQPSAPGPGRS
jgi:hypothetical protein